MVAIAGAAISGVALLCHRKPRRMRAQFGWIEPEQRAATQKFVENAQQTLRQYKRSAQALRTTIKGRLMRLQTAGKSLANQRKQLLDSPIWGDDYTAPTYTKPDKNNPDFEPDILDDNEDRIAVHDALEEVHIPQELDDFDNVIDELDERITRFSDTLQDLTAAQQDARSKPGST